jgi:hypothetical protein
MSDQPMTESQPSVLERLNAFVNEPVEQETQEQEAIPEVELDDSDIELIEGDTEEDQSIDETEEPEGELYEVKVNGDVFEVTLDELKAGYQKDRDYQIKTQALAEERKAVAEERKVLSNLGSTIETVSNAVTYLEETKSLLLAAAPVVDNSLIDKNPALYVRAKEARDLFLGKVNEIDQKIGSYKEQAEQMLSQARSAGYVKIKQAMPELTTQEGAGKLYGNLMDSYGYNAKDIDANIDPNLFIIAEKARRYDELRALPRKPDAVKPRVKGSKPVRPAGDPRAANYITAIKQFKQNPTQSNAVKAYLATKQK